MNELCDALSFVFSPGAGRVTLSNPRPACSLRRAQLRRQGDSFLLEKFTQTQAFHRTLSYQEALSYLQTALKQDFQQLNAWDEQWEYALRITKKGKLLTNRKRCAVPAASPQPHNRQKRYLLPEGQPIAPLVDMGIFTTDGRIVKAMHHKYRQINRFLEIVDDELKAWPAQRPLHIVDFGCGKSYLTFILYYFFTHVKKLDVRMTGLDLKEDVIAHCNRVALQYGYQNLRFQNGDIQGYGREEPVDMVVTLHACDTATDYALFHAVTRGARYLFSVPCCQHELAGQMRSDRLSLLTRYGIVKERAAALLTDAVRANLLEACGYRAQVLEFVDFDSTPKNLLIRARKGSPSPEAKRKALAEVQAVMDEFQLTPTLYRLLEDSNLLPSI